MSPSRPTLTTSTAVTIMNPSSSHNKYFELPAANGFTPIPRKIDGNPINTMVISIVAISVANDVFDNTTHLYRAPAVRCPSATTLLVIPGRRPTRPDTL